jgi:hypothetical protein
VISAPPRQFCFSKKISAGRPSRHNAKRTARSPRERGELALKDTCLFSPGAGLKKKKLACIPYADKTHAAPLKPAALAPRAPPIPASREKY